MQDSITTTDKFMMKFTNTAHSRKARCTTRECAAAIAMIPTRSSLSTKGIGFARNAMSRESTTGQGINRHPAQLPGSPETQCVTCHMPHTTYMEIDERRDHGIRVPRPDLTVKYGVPNVCNRCHVEPHENAAVGGRPRIVEWFGPKRPDDPHYAEAFALARRGDPAGFELLREAIDRQENTEIVRATAIELLQRYPTLESARIRREALSDPSPLVRASAVRSFADRRDVKRGVSRQSWLKRLVLSWKTAAEPFDLAAANRLVADADDLAASQYQQFA
jgi:hypothetical protein